MRVRARVSWSKGTSRNLIAAAAVLVLLIAPVAIRVAILPQPASAISAEPGFPRLGLWWPDHSDPMNIADVARYDWVCLADWSKGSVAQIHAVNPQCRALNSSNARELRYDTNHGPTYCMNAELAAASPQWILTQLGSTLSSAVNATTTSIPVADASRFAVDDVAVCENELMRVTAVGANSITVRRDWLKPGSAHAQGVRIAPAYQTWPTSVVMDLTDRCPAVDVGNGPETWAEYNARIGKQLTQTAAWDGLYVDCSNGNVSHDIWSGAGSHRRSIDYFRNNIPTTDNYASLDAEWNAGLTNYQTLLRVLLSDKLIFTNGSYPNYTLMNGTAFEEGPNSAGGQYGVPWASLMFGPLDRGSVKDWMAQSGTPNLTTLLTYGDDTGSGTTTNYQKLRFGLCSALLVGADFNYTPNQDTLGAAPLPWFDEYDGGGIGKGYLRQPAGPAARVGSVYRRDFEHGIALVNPTASATTVSLGGTFRKIRGTQVPTVNDGSLVTAVTIPPKDGLILLRPAPTGTMLVAGGATRVDSTNVTCTSDVSGASDMRIDPGTGTFGGWMTYTASVPVTLGGGYGTKTVRVDYRNAAGTTELSATVVLVAPDAGAAGATPPSTTISELPAAWTGSDVTFSLVASDAASPDGVATYYGLNAAALTPYTAPVAVSAEGTTTISYFSVDASGDAEAAKTTTVRIDKRAPVTTDDHSGTYVGGGTIHLAARDSLSGVAVTNWVLDGVASSGTAVSVSSLGSHTLQYCSQDAAGNCEATKTVTFSVVAAPSITSAGFTNPIAYGIKSLLTTRMQMTCDTSNVNAKLVVHVPGGDWTVYNGNISNAAGEPYTFPAWNGKNPATGKRAPYSANYGWTLTVAKNGQSATKTGNLLLSTIYFQAKGTSVGGHAVLARCYLKGSRTAPGSVNFYISASSSASFDQLTSRITGPGRYAAVPAPMPWRLPVPTSVPKTPTVSGRSGIKANGIYNIYLTGRTNVTYAVSVIE